MMLNIQLPRRSAPLIVQPPSSVNSISQLIPWLHAKYKLSQSFRSYNLCFQHAVIESDCSISNFPITLPLHLKPISDNGENDDVAIQRNTLPNVPLPIQSSATCVPEKQQNDNVGDIDVDMESNHSKLTTDNVAPAPTQNDNKGTPNSSRLSANARKRRNERNRQREKRRRLENRLSSNNNSVNNDSINNENEDGNENEKDNQVKKNKTISMNQQQESEIFQKYKHQFTSFMNIVNKALKYPSDHIRLPRLVLTRHLNLLENVFKINKTNTNSNVANCSPPVTNSSIVQQSNLDSNKRQFIHVNPSETKKKLKQTHISPSPSQPSHPKKLKSSSSDSDSDSDSDSSSDSDSDSESTVSDSSNERDIEDGPQNNKKSGNASENEPSKQRENIINDERNTDNIKKQTNQGEANVSKVDQEKGDEKYYSKDINAHDKLVNREKNTKMDSPKPHVNNSGAVLHNGLEVNFESNANLESYNEMMKLLERGFGRQSEEYEHLEDNDAQGHKFNQQVTETKKKKKVKRRRKKNSNNHDEKGGNPQQTETDNTGAIDGREKNCNSNEPLTEVNLEESKDKTGLTLEEIENIVASKKALINNRVDAEKEKVNTNAETDLEITTGDIAAQEAKHKTREGNINDSKGAPKGLVEGVWIKKEKIASQTEQDEDETHKETEREEGKEKSNESKGTDNIRRSKPRRIGSISAALEMARRSGALNQIENPEGTASSTLHKKEKEKEKSVQDEDDGDDYDNYEKDEDLNSQYDAVAPKNTPKKSRKELSLKEAEQEEQYNTSFILVAQGVDPSAQAISADADNRSVQDDGQGG